VKAQNRGTTQALQNSELAEHLDSLTSNLQNEQDKWDMENQDAQINWQEMDKAMAKSPSKK
jgi:hypothetical protein